MRKIPTLFLRDPDDMRRVLREVNPAAAWVLDGEARATRKFDGTCVMLDSDERWWARREVKPAKTSPPNYRPVQTDPATGKTVGWEPVEQSSFAKAHGQALAASLGGAFTAGTYELCGPSVNRNPEGYGKHVLVPHGLFLLGDIPLDYDGLRGYLAELAYEGIVWHHPDGRMAKLKRRDFPPSECREDPVVTAAPS